MKRDEATTLPKVLEEIKQNGKGKLRLKCVSHEHYWTKDAGINVGDILTFTHLVSSGDEDDLMENLDPALYFEETSKDIGLSYIDFELVGFDNISDDIH